MTPEEEEEAALKRQALIDDAAAKELTLATARLTNAKALQDEIDRKSPLAIQSRDATAAKDIALAKKATAEANREAATGWVPDLSAVTGGTTKFGEAPVMYGPSLSASAITSAARDLAAAVEPALAARSQDRPLRILVTDQAQLVDSGGSYLDTVAQAETLLNAANSEIAKSAEARRDQPSPLPEGEIELIRIRGVEHLANIMAGVAATAAETPASAPAEIAENTLASIIPEIASLFSVDRTLSYATQDIDVITAHAAVVDAVLALDLTLTVTHDAFRTLPRSGIYGTVRELQIALVGLRTATLAEDALVSSITLVQPPDAAPDEVKRKFAADKKRVDDAKNRQAAQAARAAAIEAFVVSVAAKPEVGHSRLTLAAMREQLHGGENGAFDFVLLVPKPTAGAHQILSDRKIGWDRLSVGAAASLSYMLMDPRTGEIASSGVSGGRSGLAGRVGGQLALQGEDDGYPRGTSWFTLGRGLLLVALSSLLVGTPGLSVDTITIALAAFALLGGLALVVQSVVMGNTVINARSLAAQGLLGFLVGLALVVLPRTPAFSAVEPWFVVGVAILLLGVLELIGKSGLAGGRAEGFAWLAGVVSVIAGGALMASVLFFREASTPFVPTTLGLVGLLVGLALTVASSQARQIGAPARR